MGQVNKYAGISSFVVFTLLPLISSSFLTWWLYRYQEGLQGWGIGQWLLFSMVLAVLCALAVVPPTYLAIVMGFFLNWPAFPLLVVINLLAIGLIFWLSRQINFSWVENWLRSDPKRAKVLNRIQEQELKVIFFTKLSPVFPFALTNLIFAASGATFKHILAGGFLGMIPRTALAVYAGAQARELRQLLENPEQSNWSQWVVAALVIISVAGLFFVLKKAFK